MKTEVKFDYSRVKPGAMAKIQRLPKQVQNEIARKLTEVDLETESFIRISEHSKYYIKVVELGGAKVLDDVIEKISSARLRTAFSL